MVSRLLSDNDWKRRVAAIEENIETGIRPTTGDVQAEDYVDIYSGTDRIAWYLYLLDTAQHAPLKYEPVQGARVSRSSRGLGLIWFCLRASAASRIASDGFLTATAPTPMVDCSNSSSRCSGNATVIRLYAHLALARYDAGPTSCSSGLTCRRSQERSEWCETWLQYVRSCNDTPQSCHDIFCMLVGTYDSILCGRQVFHNRR